MKIFISYEHGSQIYAETAQDLLKSHTVHWDFSRLYGGVEFEEKLKSLIADSDIVLFFVSREALRSYWCITEIGYAHALQKKIVPILVNGVKSEDVKNFPIIGTRNHIVWKDKGAFIQEIDKVLTAEIGIISVSPVHFIFKGERFEFAVTNNSIFDLFDLTIEAIVKYVTDPGQISWTREPVKLRTLKLSKGMSVIYPLDCKDLKTKERIGKGEWQSGDELEILVRYTFQNQERYFVEFEAMALNSFKKE